MARPTLAYRLVLAEEWSDMQRDGIYKGSALDIRDGYLHMSPAEEVRPTATRYFAGCADLVLLCVDLASPAIASHVRWDLVPSRKADFPHLYDIMLPLSAVKSAARVPLGSDGAFVWPDTLPQ